MNLQTLIETLDLKTLTLPQDYSAIEPANGYASDMLSCVLAGAKSHDVWITLQAHANVIAVAAMLDLSAVILSENVQPDADVLARANQQSVILLSSPLPTYEISGKLWELGMRST
jgi:hypothetical protein